MCFLCWNWQVDVRRWSILMAKDLVLCRRWPVQQLVFLEDHQDSQLGVVAIIPPRIIFHPEKYHTSTDSACIANVNWLLLRTLESLSEDGTNLKYILGVTRLTSS